MILVIGGAYQGKLEFSKNLLASSQRTMIYADGENDHDDQVWNATIINGFHEFIRKKIEPCEEQSIGKMFDVIGEWIQKILKENPDVIIIMNEIGYGIVPINPEDRFYREVVGHFGQLLAKEADSVYRVICGIGNQIK